MTTPKEHLKELEQKIIAEKSLDDALYSVNKRAKNWRDKEREAKHTYGKYSFANQNKAAEEKEKYYEQKEKLLSILEPICIHKEFAGFKKTRVSSSEPNFEEKSFAHCMAGDIVWENCFEKYTEGYSVHLFDYVDFSSPVYRYYLFYCCGEHSYHTPIDFNQISQYNLPVHFIDTIKTEGKDTNELASTAFVKKVIAVIDEKNFTLVYDENKNVNRYPNGNLTESDFLAEEKTKYKPDVSGAFNYVQKAIQNKARYDASTNYSIIFSDIAKVKIFQKNKNGVWKQPNIQPLRHIVEKQHLSAEEELELLALYTSAMNIKTYIKALIDNNCAVYHEAYETAYANAVNDKISNKVKVWTRDIYKQKRDAVTIKDIYSYARDEAYVG